MKRILILFAVIVSNLSFGQAIKDVDAYQSGNEIVIMYTIDGSASLPAGRRFNVVPSFSIDGGKKYTQLKSVTGDLYNLSVGNSKIIRWKVLQDYASFVHSNVIFKVDLNAVQSTGSTYKPASSYNSPSSSSGTGEDYYRKGEECERNKKYAEAIKNYRIASQKGYKKADERIKALQLKFW